MTGILGNEWTMKEFTPMGDIPSLVRLTVYMGEFKNLSKDLLQEFIDEVAKGTIKLTIDKVFRLDEVSRVHEYLEGNKAKGKIVVKHKNSLPQGIKQLLTQAFLRKFEKTAIRFVFLKLAG